MFGLDLKTIVIIGILLAGAKFAEQFVKKSGESSGKTNVSHYKKKNLLTKTEYSFWMALNKACVENGFLVCPKVRLEDFVSVDLKEGKQRQSYRGRIKSRHVDFLICDSGLRILAGVELDDNSHNSKKAQELDSFKDNVFEQIKVPLIRIKTGGGYALQIEKLIKQLRGEDEEKTETSEGEKRLFGKMRSFKIGNGGNPYGDK